MPPSYDDPHAYDYVSDRRSGGKVKCNLAFRIILIILALVCLAFIATCFGVNWTSYNQTDPAPTKRAHIRLWRIAVDDEGNGFYNDPFIAATRAFMIIGLVCALVAFILLIVYAVTRSSNEKEREEDDAEREAVRQEYLRRLQERRRREEEARREGRENSSFVRNYDVRPPSHPRSYYIDRENRRLLKDWYFGIAIWIVLFFLMASMAICVGCYAAWYKRDVVDLEDSKLVIGFWLLCASLAISFVAFVLFPITPATGFNLCIGDAKARKI